MSAIADRFENSFTKLVKNYGFDATLSRMNPGGNPNIEIPVKLVQAVRGTEQPIGHEISAEDMLYRLPASSLSGVFAMEPPRKGDRLITTPDNKTHTIRLTTPIRAAERIIGWVLTTRGGSA